MTADGVRGSGVGWRFWRHQLRYQSAIAIAVAVTSLLAALLVSAAPRALEHASVADVRSALVDATPEQRNIRFELAGRVGARSQAMPFGSLDVRGDELLEQIPTSVADVVTDRQWVYDSPLFTVSSFPGQSQGPFPTTFRFRHQQGVEDQLIVVRGRLPERAPQVTMLVGPDCPTDDTAPENFEREVEQRCQAADVPVYETALSQQTAAAMMVDVGDRVTLTPANTDTAWRAAPSGALAALLVLDVSGIIELTDQTSDFWFEDSSLHRPRITENPDFRLVGAVGLMLPEQYQRFMHDVPAVDNRYTWRYIVDPDLVTSASARRLAGDVERINPAGYDTSTLLPEVLGEHIAQRRLTVQLMSTSAAGVYSVAIAAIVALALLGAIRQRSSTELIVGRGASVAQLRVNAVRTALLIVCLPAFAGWGIAWWSFPNTASGAPTRAAVTLSVGAVLAIVVTSVPIGSMADSAERDRRRVVAEALIVVAAVGSVLLLRQRTSVDERVNGGLDLLLISSPALLACAAGLMAARLVGPFARVGAAVGRRGRTLGSFVGFRRLVAQPPSARTPVLVMTIAVATAVLSSVLASSVATGQSAAAWGLVGGDYRVRSFVSGLPLPIGLDSNAFGDRSSAFGTELTNQRVGEGASAATLDLVAIDVDAYRAMLDGSGFTGVGLDELAVGATQPDAVPAVAIGRWPARAEPAVGERLTLTSGASNPSAEVVAVIDRFPGLPARSPVLLMDLDDLRAATNERLSQPTFVVLTGGEGDLAEISQIVDDQGALAILTSRYERLEAIAGDPFSTWTNRVLWAVTAISLAFVAVAAVSAAAIAAATRRRDIALLRVLGLRPSESRLIAAIEHIPSVAAALGVGVVTGVLTAILLEPILGLAAFAGGGPGVGVSIDSRALAGLVAAAGLAAAVGLGASQRITGRGDGAKMLRVGDP